MLEWELVERAKQGNKSALNQLFTDNYKILSGYVLKLCCDEELAKDIVQEALLKAVINIKSFTPKAKFSTWLITIATNLYRDYLRKNKRLVYMEEVQGGAVEVEDRVMELIEYRNVMNIIKELPYEKRTVFILKHYYNFKYEEIAEIMKCPVGTVRSRLHNSIKDILKKLKERGMMNEEN
ncbi:RNA polymerase sigma factor SigY [Clostridium polynesiense]|uniref:RNA polymerase sigma factor SigY n=1 Tax=Clostridium polynesiense TaxID=1325933 RepID=UPI00058D9CA4|nr:RNA polymerase sigma factor SigY [Clostridium polynesiense]